MARRYHWSVEYFEDLRNVNHCEFIIMDKNIDNGKYLLKSELRTWSELKKQRAIEAAKSEASRDQSHQPHRPVIDPKRRNTLSQFLPNNQPVSTPPPARKWGGCVAGCDHKHDKYPRRKLQDLKEDSATTTDPPPEKDGKAPYEGEDHPIAHQEDASTPTADEYSVSPTNTRDLPIRPGKTPAQMFVEHYNDSGTETPHERGSSDVERDSGDYFDPASSLAPKSGNAGTSRKPPRRQPTEEDLERWANESGMGSGKRADALGDEPEDADESDNLEEMEKKDKSLRGSVY